MQRKLKKTKMLDEYVAKESFDKLKEIVDECKEMQNLSINTLKNFNKVYTELYEYFGNEKNAFELSEFDARNFVKFLQNEKIHYKDKIHKTGKQRGLRPTTINSYIKLCKTIYQELVDAEYIESNPFRSIRCMSRQNERIKTIPPADIKKLLESLNTEYFTDFRTYVIIHLLLDTIWSYQRDNEHS